MTSDPAPNPSSPDGRCASCRHWKQQAEEATGLNVGTVHTMLKGRKR